MRTIHQFRRLLALGRAPAWTYLAVPAATLLGAALSVLPPRFTGEIIDALGRRRQHDAMFALALYVATTILATLVSLGGGQASRLQRDSMGRNLRLALFARLNRAPFDALSNLSLGEVTNRILGDVQTLSGALEFSVLPAAASICTLVATVCAMAQESAYLAAIAVLFALLTFVPQVLFRKRFETLQNERARANDVLYGVVGSTTTLASLVTLRCGPAFRSVMKRVSDATGALLRNDLEQGVVASEMSLISAVLGAIGPTAVLAIGAYLATHGRITTGTIVTLLIYQSRMLAPFASIAQIPVALTSLGVVTRRLLEIEDLPQERDGSHEFAAGEICWSGVCVKRESRTVLDNVNLTLAPGEHVAVVGLSGAGKSTLGSTILRFTEPCRGTISIGGRDIREFSLESLRSAACIAEQHVQIFDGTLLENITLKCSSSDAADIERALTLSHLNALVEQMPDGLLTNVGPRGVRLSGGEQQRICLARALMQKPDILILDEALTGVDAEMEAAIIEGLRREFRGRALLVVTHRLNTVARFDKIVVMSAGTVVAQGAHEALQTANAWYNTAFTTAIATGVIA